MASPGGPAPQPEASRRGGPRERIVEAMVDLMLQRGYEETTVEAVIERAAVRRADFDRHFAGKQDCCLQVYLRNNELFDRRVQAAFAAHESWRDALRAAAYASADYFTEYPRRVRFNTIAVLGAGEMLAVQRDAYLQHLADLIDAGRNELPDPDSVPRSLAESVIGSVFERILRDIHRGDAAVHARDVVPELMYIAVRPYLGHEVALQELSVPPPPNPLGAATPEPPRQSRTEARTAVQTSAAPSYGPGVSKREPPGGDSAPGLPRLPPGRHGLPRSFVAQNQRDRLTAGIIAAVAEHGYHETTITQIAAAAGVSRRTFYTYFSSKEECYLATYDVIAAHLAEAARAAAAPHRDWPDRVRAQLAASLEFFAANPDLVRFYLIAPPRAGEEVAARYRLGASRVIAELTRGMPSGARRPTQAIQNALAGGMAGLIVGKVRAGEGERLPELLPDLTELFLTPYLGREAAARAAREGA